MIDYFMNEAIKEAELALEEGGYPIGAVLVKNDKFIAKGRSRSEQENNPILHAEIDAIQNAKILPNYRNVILYSTLIPCYLCAGALVHFGIKKIIIGDTKSYIGAENFLKDWSIEIIDLNSNICKNLIKKFINKSPELWKQTLTKDYAKYGIDYIEELDFEKPFCKQSPNDPTCKKCKF